MSANPIVSMTVEQLVSRVSYLESGISLGLSREALLRGSAYAASAGPRTMITQQQRDLRNAIVNHADYANPDLDHTTAELISVLGSVIEGIPIERAMGSPGNWGYGTPIGAALLALIQSQP